LLAEQIVMVFAVRDDGDARLSGLPELWITGLSDVDARAVLMEGLHSPLDPAIVDRLVADTHGNPLALLELPRTMSSVELSGGLALPSPASVANRIESGFARRIADLPSPAQRLLVVAAAEPVGDPLVLWRAAGTIGISADAAAPAIDLGLIEISSRVVFRHPLARSAAYRRASTTERREAHRALAEATDPDDHPERRAWHRALAVVGPDEEVAAELERSAGRAQARGGLVAAAALLERSASLTLDPARRAQRAISAAGTHLEAGIADNARLLLAAAEAGPLDEFSLALVELMRGYAEIAWGDCRDAATSLLDAAKRLEQLDVRLARSTYHAALDAAVISSDLARGTTVVEAAHAARDAPGAPEPARPLDLSLDGLALATTEGPAAAAPTLRRALTAFRGDDLPPEERVRFPGLAPAALLWDFEGWRELCSRQVQVLRELGALTMLPFALSTTAEAELFAGDLSSAASHVAELESVVEVTGIRFASYTAARLAGWRGLEDEALPVIEAVIAQARVQGQGVAIKLAQSARAILYNGLARYDLALVAADEAHRDPFYWSAHLTLPELVEAASRSDERTVAERAFDRLVATTQASGSDWALGVEARSRALLTSGDEAEACYIEATERLDRSPVRAEAARAHLLYGEWLRREHRRVDARAELAEAHDAFNAMGALGFAERAAREVAATGATVRKRSVDTRFELTAQEAQIARLAAKGHTNPEIGALLYLSARTVEWHLGKVYPKLGIASRKDLSRALGDEGRNALRA